MESVEDYGIKRIVVAVDISDYSEMVVARASAMAIAFSAEIHVISVVGLPKLIALRQISGYMMCGSAEKEFQEQQKRLIDEYLKGHDLHIDHVCSTEILPPRYFHMQMRWCGLDCHGQQVLWQGSRLLFGGVSEDVVRNAKCPVMIAR